MKLALIGPVYPYRGGIAHHTTMLGHALSQRHELLVISFKRLYPLWLYPGNSDQDPSQASLSITANYILDSLAPWTWWRAFHHIRRFQPDLVIIPWWTTFLAPMTAGLVAALQHVGVRVSVLIHNVLPHDPRLWDTWLTRWALGAGRMFITQTESEKNRLLALFPNVAVKVTPHPIYEMFTEQAIPQSIARQHLNIPADVPIALFFGIVRPYKGLKYLLDAMAQIRDRGGHIHLVVAGEFWESRAGYDQQIQDLCLSEHIHFFSHYIPNEDVGLLFSAANVLVAPYVAVTQSGVIKLALGFGLPVLTTRLGEMEELQAWVKTGQVRLVKPRDANALAEALMAGQSSGWMRDRLPQAAKTPPASTWNEFVTTLEHLAQAHL